jgi:hypothetical protein
MYEPYVYTQVPEVSYFDGFKYMQHRVIYGKVRVYRFPLRTRRSCYQNNNYIYLAAIIFFYLSLKTAMYMIPHKCAKC